jgi:hypothetical protein
MSSTIATCQFFLPIFFALPFPNPAHSIYFATHLHSFLHNTFWTYSPKTFSPFDVLWHVTLWNTYKGRLSGPTIHDSCIWIIWLNWLNSLSSHAPFASSSQGRGISSLHIFSFNLTKVSLILSAQVSFAQLYPPCSSHFFYPPTYFHNCVFDIGCLLTP